MPSAWPPVGRLEQWLGRLLAVLTGAVLLHAAVRLAVKAFRYLASPYSRDYGEGCVLAMVQLLAERGSYFPSLTDYPFVHGNYPPLFILLVWPFYALVGPSILVPRALSLLATGVLLCALYLIVRRAGASPPLAAALLGIALAPWFFQTWAPMGRVDMLALALTLAALAAYLRGAALRYVIALSALAFFTKQNALLAPAAVVVDLMIRGPRARLGRALAGFALALGLPMAALSAVTGGEAYRHLVLYTATAAYEWGRMAESYLELLRVAWPLLLPIAVAAARAPALLVRGGTRVLFIYWVMSLTALATIAKAGAAQNYLIEPWLATVALSAVTLPALSWPAAGQTAMLPVAAPRAWLLVAATVALYTNNDAHRLPQPIRHPERAEDYRDLWETVRTTSGPILSENLAVLVLHRKPVLVEPFGMLLLTRAGRVSPDRLVRDCEAGKFALIVNEYRLEQIPGFQHCLDHRYEAFKDLATYRLFRPRAPGPRRQGQ